MYLADPAAWTPTAPKSRLWPPRPAPIPAQVPDILSGFTFLPMAEQTGDDWLGGAAPKIKTTADFLVKAGRIDAALDDYSAFVNPTLRRSRCGPVRQQATARATWSGQPLKTQKDGILSLKIDNVSVIYPAADGRPPVAALSESIFRHWRASSSSRLAPRAAASPPF
jgi:hypothetical protein